MSARMSAVIGHRSLLVLWDVDHTLIENSGVSKETYLAAFEVLTGRRAEHRPDTEGRTDPEIMLADHDMPVTEEYEARLFGALEQALTSRKPRLQLRGHALPGASRPSRPSGRCRASSNRC